MYIKNCFNIYVDALFEGSVRGKHQQSVYITCVHCEIMRRLDLSPFYILNLAYHFCWTLSSCLSDKDILAYDDDDNVGKYFDCSSSSVLLLLSG